MNTSNESEVLHMKKGLTELVFILDRSGSMGGLESDTMITWKRMCLTGIYLTI